MSANAYEIAADPPLLSGAQSPAYRTQDHESHELLNVHEEPSTLKFNKSALNRLYFEALHFDQEPQRFSSEFLRNQSLFYIFLGAYLLLLIIQP